MSSSQKLEYVASLPTHVSTYHYAAGALKEIKQLINEAQQPMNSKLIFQTLPKHMRRRAMSHHPKRLPRKYRQAHTSQMSKGGNQPVNHKRPSRKYRRRPGNLLKDYERRQRQHKWLETHIWHAKRFHMVKRWGYSLPWASCDKTFRACYRASTKHCLIQDMSYYTCVELQGGVETLKEGFKQMTSQECGLSITAKTYLKGQREGQVEMFKRNQYPRGALQRASFMWKPPEEVEKEQDGRTLWLWLHPSAAEKTLEEMIQVFQLKSKMQQKVQMVTVTQAFQLKPLYSNEEDTLHLSILQGEFNRFRLTGAGVQRLLAKSLALHQQQDPVYKDYCQNVLNLDNPTGVMSNLILALKVKDPRLQRPQKRSKPLQEMPLNPSKLLPPPLNPLASALWQPQLRQNLLQNFVDTSAHEKLRQQQVMVPGLPCPFEEQLQAVPLLLIQRPGSLNGQYKRLGYASGWDIIAPKRYGLILWLTLIMWGARAGGLRESESVARESGEDLHLPDTLAGVREQHVSEVEQRLKYFRLPPNKRFNYRKLAVVSPFRSPWLALIRDWLKDSSPPSTFYVLRSRSLLESLELSLLRGKTWPLDLPSDCLIQIHLTLTRRGHLQDQALICLPQSLDFKRLWRQLKNSDLSPVHLEPLHFDLNEKLRQNLRSQHKLKLKRLRARRVREKRLKQQTATKRVHIRPAQTAQMVRLHSEEMCRLWLPLDPSQTQQSVRRQCSRQVFGYVSKAGFSYTEAKVCAVGYVTPLGLKELIKGANEGKGRKVDSTLCLVRNANSRDYRWARFKINLNVTSMPI